MKISKALNRFMKEDPTFIAHTDSETKEVLKLNLLFTKIAYNFWNGRIALGNLHSSLYYFKF